MPCQENNVSAVDIHFDFAPGDVLWIVGLDVRGTVVRVAADRNGPCYLVDLWCESKRATEWLYPHEVCQLP